MAPVTIGAGPGFEAGVDVDAVVETKRGHDLGKVIYKGTTCADTGVPGNVMGYSQERLLRAPVTGVIRNIREIGDIVKQGLKIGDIDPRGIREYCFTISDKSRAVAGGVLEAILTIGR